MSRLIDEDQPEELAKNPHRRSRLKHTRKANQPERTAARAVLAALRFSGAKTVLDLGCGEGKLIRELLKDRQFEEIVGMDVSIRSLEMAKDRLRLDRLPPAQAQRVKLIHAR